MFVNDNRSRETLLPIVKKYVNSIPNVIIKNNEAFLLNSYIALYEQGNQFNHDERRSRKLLLHKKEILKLKEKIKLQGLTLVPLKMYFKNGKVKVLVGVCKGKKNYDKRQTIKERDIKRSNNLF